jgi:hypothetical protein
MGRYRFQAYEYCDTIVSHLADCIRTWNPGSICIVTLYLMIPQPYLWYPYSRAFLDQWQEERGMIEGDSHLDEVGCCLLYCYCSAAVLWIL